MLDRVLAVIDLQRGRAVRGIGGRRDHYQPVFFDQADWSDPLALGRYYLRQHVGGLYVADLDALTGGAMQTELIGGLIELGCPLWIDAGIRGGPDGEYSPFLLRSPHLRWILATESFGLDRESSQRWRAELPAERFTVSIDMMHGTVLTPASSTGGDEPLQGDPENLPRKGAPGPLEAIDFFYSLGFRSFLILDLAFVGGGGGPSCLELCRAIRAQFADIHLISGGGVRHGNDLQKLFTAGVDHALVASALQNRAFFGFSQAAKD